MQNPVSRDDKYKLCLKMNTENRLNKYIALIKMAGAESFRCYINPDCKRYIWTYAETSHRKMKYICVDMYMRLHKVQTILYGIVHIISE